jgi:hypothetical protein
MRNKFLLPALPLAAAMFSLAGATMFAAGVTNQGTLLVDERTVAASALGAVTLRPVTEALANSANCSCDALPPGAYAVSTALPADPIYEIVSINPSVSLTASPSFSDTAAKFALLDSFDEPEILAVAPVPEPATWLGASLALPFVFWLRARLRGNRHSPNASAKTR